jgi:uncharacterized membrane protein
MQSAEQGAPRVAAAHERTPTSVTLSALGLVLGAVVVCWHAPGSYQIYLALHVVAAVVWVGGDATLTTLGIVFQRRQDAETLAAIGKVGAWIGPRLYTPASFALFALGVALVEKGNWGWGTVWLDLAIAGWAVTTGIGVLYVGPELGRIDRDAAAHGPRSPQVEQRVRRLFAIFRFDTALLILILIDMAAKPAF